MSTDLFHSSHPETLPLLPAPLPVGPVGGAIEDLFHGVRVPKEVGVYTEDQVHVFERHIKHLFVTLLCV